MEVGEPCSDVALAPFDARPDDVDPPVLRGRRKVLRQGKRHPADSASQIEHAFVRLEVCQADEMSQEFLANRREISATNKNDGSGRNNGAGPSGF